MKDLSVIFNPDLKYGFNPDHLNYIINEAMKKLGFIIRSTYDIKSPNTILTLFESLVLPILTCESQIWSLSAQQDHYELEKIVLRALRYAGLKVGNPILN